jgi:hypothetical protein
VAGGGGNEDALYLMLAAMIGGVPIILGLILFLGGLLTERAITREQRPRPPPAFPPPR